MMRWACCDEAVVRTTVNIDDDLLAEIKAISARTHRPPGDVIDDALRLMLARRKNEQSGHVTIPTYGGGGLQPGVDLEDKEALAELLGDNEWPPARG
jgi:hypothetical protein